ncbi:MAG: GlcG/HbpS family heme-binding protein [Chromatiales bacterium]
MQKRIALHFVIGVASLSLASEAAFAACDDVSRSDLIAAATATVPGDNGGLNFPMWVTVVDETGKVCHVVNTNGPGANSNAAWLGSRVISAQKANTANAFSHDGLALSTANLYSAVQPGGSLFGLQESNPVDASRAYRGSPNSYGTNGDPLKNKRIGGVNVFGGGLALYDEGGKVGAIGVSGDTSCTDHVVAWKIREALGLDNVPGGVSTAGDDAMIQPAAAPPPDSFGHPACAVNNPTDANDGGSIEGN